MPSTALDAAYLEALDEPALLVADGRTEIANAAALKLLGSGIAGRDVRLAIRQPQALAAVLAGVAADIEVGGIGAPGLSWKVLVRPLGQRGRLLVRLDDQTPRRAAEKMRVDFVANASHELRTPLSTVIGYAETLAEDGELDEPVRRRFGQAIHDEARRMLRIVADLMSLSRIEADRFVVPLEEVTPATLARMAANQAEPLAEQRGCRVELEIEDGLPPIIADSTQLLQLLDNLLSNAIRYGCSDRSPAVRLAMRREGASLRISVADGGEGIPDQHLPRLTERFYRVDSSRSRDAGGTGLGLAIVKHIVERHRGTLDIASTAGAGTRVTVLLPLGPAAGR